jgi:hypothetical protein
MKSKNTKKEKSKIEELNAKHLENNFLTTTLDIEFSFCCHKCGEKIFGKKTEKQVYSVTPTIDIYRKS